MNQGQELGFDSLQATRTQHFQGVLIGGLLGSVPCFALFWRQRNGRVKMRPTRGGLQALLYDCSTAGDTVLTEKSDSDHKILFANLIIARRDGSEFVVHLA